MTERDLQSQIRLAIGKRPDRVVLWRNNVGTAQAFDPRTGCARTIRYGLAVGSADLIGIQSDGRFVALELKTERGRLRPEQRAWLALVERMGGLVGVPRSVADAEEILGL